MIIKRGCAVLRAIEQKDLPLLKELINNPHIEYMTQGSNFPVSDFEQQRWFETFNRQKDLRLIAETVDGDAYGYVALLNIDWRNGTACIGGKLKNNKKRIRGDVRDSTMGMLDYAFNEMNLNCVEAYVLEHNGFSILNLKRCGFTQEGLMRSRVYKRGKHCNQLVFSMLKSEFQALELEAEKLDYDTLHEEDM
jgi:RimJ/RimL family protein N-acetyltransferase